MGFNKTYKEALVFLKDLSFFYILSQITKTDFDAKLSSLNRKITQNKSKHLLVENELNKLKTFDSSYFIGKSHFGEDGTQNYLVFQPMYRCFKMITNTNYFHHGNLKDYLVTVLNHLQHLIIILLQHSIIMVLKKE